MGLELVTAVAERLARAGRRGCVCRRAPARALVGRAAQAVRGETSASDGSIELVVELLDLELLALARTTGVQILEVQGADTPCAPADLYLQSSAVLSVAK